MHTVQNALCQHYVYTRWSLFRCAMVIFMMIGAWLFTQLVEQHGCLHGWHNPLYIVVVCCGYDMYSILSYYYGLNNIIPGRIEHLTIDDVTIVVV